MTAKHITQMYNREVGNLNDKRQRGGINDFDYFIEKDKLSDNLTLSIKEHSKSKFNDKDIAAIEFIHDRLIDVYKESSNVDFLLRVREVTNKIYKLLK